MVVNQQEALNLLSKQQEMLNTTILNLQHSTPIQHHDNLDSTRFDLQKHSTPIKPHENLDSARFQEQHQFTPIRQPEDGNTTNIKHANLSRDRSPILPCRRAVVDSEPVADVRLSARDVGERKDFQPAIF